MDIRERNRKNVISRWKKLQEKEKEYIKDNKEKTSHLKARICGFLAGDGNILKNNGKTCSHNTIRFFPDHISLVKSFNEAFKKVYNKKTKIINKNNYYWIYADSKIIVEDLLETAKFDKLGWEVPYNIFSTKKEKVEWLRAFFDCEAHVHSKYISTKSVNEKGLVQVKNLLKEFDINSKIYKYVPKNKKWNTNFMLNIGRKKDKEKYANLIGFNHTIKLKKLNKNLNIKPGSRNLVSHRSF